MALRRKHIAILAEDLFEDLELWYPLYRLTEAGAKITVLGTGQGGVSGQGGSLSSVMRAWVLISAGLVRGRRVTSFPSIRDDLQNAGAQWSNEEVVVDENLVSSRRPDDLPAFCRAIIEWLSDSPARQQKECHRERDRSKKG